jgi:hypothetical protein
MATYSLDQLREDIERKYAPFSIDLGDGRTVNLRPVLRLPETDRRRFSEVARRVQDAQADGDGADLAELGDSIRGMLRVVADPPEAADALLAALPDDAYAVELLTRYMEATQPGEVSPSQS